jgi:tRNA pseudouridine55 synthase
MLFMTPLLLYKPKGLTPLQAVTLLKKQHPEVADQTLSYAGRLDPIAEGLLLILPGELNKKRKEYEDFEKTYAFTLLCGVSTDTYDPLGKIVQTTDSHLDEKGIQKTLEKILTTLPSSFLLPYPPYSSKPVQGKPLFWWARQNKISEIPIPTRRVSITSITLLSSTLLETSVLHKNIKEAILLVSGDFRQEEILKKWDDFFAHTPLSHFPLFSFQITCGSGTYIRSLCQLFGEKLLIPSLAYSIKRTRIGPYSLADNDVYYIKTMQA